MFPLTNRIGATRQSILSLYNNARVSSLDLPKALTTYYNQDPFRISMVYTSSTNIEPGAARSQEDVDTIRPDPIAILQNMKARAGIGHREGLREVKHRVALVFDFFQLSQMVINGKLSVNDLQESKTFDELSAWIDQNVDLLSNGQLINILSSAILINLHPAHRLMKLLEHELKFRVQTLTFAQVVKILRFYNSGELGYDQRQITDKLHNRLRKIIESISNADLINFYKRTNYEKVSNNIVGSVEGALTERLLEELVDQDDVTKLIFKDRPRYRGLCDIFISAAMAQRRPTPLLKVASQLLAMESMSDNQADDIDVPLILETLESLAKLNYTNRNSISKLISDLEHIADLDKLDINTLCGTLRTINSLKWRSEALMQKFCDYLVKNHANADKVDANLILNFIHVTAQLNYTPKLDLLDLYKKLMNKSRLDSIDKKSRKWLNHVWSLSKLKIADVGHLESVLNDSYLSGMLDVKFRDTTYYADAMKLLNLRAIASLEFGLVIQSSLLDKCATEPIQSRGAVQKLREKVQTAMAGLTSSANQICYDIHTPFGFKVDGEFRLDAERNITSFQAETFLSDTIKSGLKQESETTDVNKCVFVCVPYDETLLNEPSEPLAHRLLISRILQNLGYRTFYLTDSLTHKDQTSSDLMIKIKEALKK